MDSLFSWVHISDVHFGHGSPAETWDQKLVVEELAADVTNVTGRGYPSPNCLLVTGDVAFSGGTRVSAGATASTEYADARKWLEDLRVRLKLAPADIYIVPGNHDVQRNVAEHDRNVRRVLSLARAGDKDENIVDLLRDQGDRELIRRRMANFLDFSAEYGPQPRSDPFFWTHILDLSGGLRVRIACLNSAMLCADDQDHGKLELGNEQIVGAMLNPGIQPGELVLALTHHPFDWLRDGAGAEQIARKYAHVHLCGHIHKADASWVRDAGGSQLIRIVAGAVHENAQAGSPPSRYGYSFGSVHCTAKGLELRYWPRLWSPDCLEFRKDIILRDDERYATFPLPVTLGARPHRETASPAKITAAPDPGEQVPALRSVAEGLALNSQEPHAVEVLLEAIALSGHIADGSARAKELLHIAALLIRLGAVEQARVATSLATQAVQKLPASLQAPVPLAPTLNAIELAASPSTHSGAGVGLTRRVRISALFVSAGSHEPAILNDVIDDLNARMAPALGVAADIELAPDGPAPAADILVAIMPNAPTGAGIRNLENWMRQGRDRGRLLLCLARSDAFLERDRELRAELARGGQLFFYTKTDDFAAVAQSQLMLAIGRYTPALVPGPASVSRPIRERVAGLAREYELIRKEMPSGDARTLKMDSVVMRMKRMAGDAAAIIDRLKASTSAGERLAAIAVAEELPKSDHIEWLAHRFDHAGPAPSKKTAVEKAFVQYHAGVALRIAARQLRSECPQALDAAIHYAIHQLRYLRPESDRLVVLTCALNELTRPS